MYQVVWVRPLLLVFGGSHLAVSTVLSVFMGGLALGGLIFGRRADRTHRPLRLYAALEIGIALSAAAFFVLLSLFPALYVPLARLGAENPAYLTVLRATLAALGMIVPTTLMGGTLPVLVRVVGARAGGVEQNLSFLYALNTLGAVVGTLAAGFVLLPGLGVTRTIVVAVAINLVVGTVALLLPERLFAASPAASADRSAARSETAAASPGAAPVLACVLVGIGISGFCALGYEVLWTRVLTMVVGTSVYSFTILLAAFLTGIAAGGQANSLLLRRSPESFRAWPTSAAAFGVVQLLIGVTSLAVTYALGNLPAHAVRLQRLFSAGAGEFSARQGACIVLAFGFLVVPAFFMGLAFPLAAGANAARRGALGRAVGEVLAVNTVGAILGAAAAGFVLIGLVGVERSLQSLALLNVALGVVVLAGLAATRRRATVMAGAAGVCVLLGALAAARGWDGAWDRKFFAIWRNNQRAAFDSPERIADALANTDVLYFHEGANETISVVRPRGAQQAFIVNGRVEASTSAHDRQCQLTLGHLPMLAHAAPRKVFVLGTGTGMTLGATTLHPEAEQIVLAEIEPGVLPAARTFAPWNHRALDDPRVRVVFNDGRNFLRTTRERFDVITADPIHPWSGGASYLYTAEYFRLAASRLTRGGVLCQWLPIYELAPEDLRAVVRSFAAGFPHVKVWLTHYDAELLGSSEPIVFDREAMERRIATSPVMKADLDSVFMGTAADFMSYFLAGNEGLKHFAQSGILNTDDNLWLEFHSPRSQGVAHLMGDNVAALATIREPGTGHEDAAALYDRAHALFLWGRAGSAEFASVYGALRARYPDFAPGRFLAGEVEERLARQPRLLDRTRVALLVPDGGRSSVEISAVVQRIGPERGVVSFVDNEARVIYGEKYIDAPSSQLEERIAEVSRRVIRGLREEAGRAPLAPDALRARIAALVD